MASKSDYTQRGSAIIYIFIGVALFGALMFMFSRGASQGSGGTLSAKDKIVAQEIADYGHVVERAVDKLLLKGCSEKDLRFYHPNFIDAGDYGGQADYLTPPNNTCHVFDPDGGNVKWQSSPKDSLDAGYVDYAFGGGMGIYNLGGNGCEDTELYILMRVTRNVCMAYNQIFGVTNTGNNPPQFQYGEDWYWDSGTVKTPRNSIKFGWSDTNYYGCGVHIGDSSYTPSGSELISKTSGCFQAMDGTDVYYAYHVLLVR